MATGYEKFEEAVKNLPRDKKIDKLVDDMSQWDFDNIIGWAQEEMREKLNHAPSEDLDYAYINAFDHEADVYTDDEKLEQKPDVCKCDIQQLMRGDGHNDNCPERKK